jgi:hypothetical protein
MGLAVLLSLLAFAGCAKDDAKVCTPLAPQNFIDAMRAEAAPTGATTG